MFLTVLAVQFVEISSRIKLINKRALEYTILARNINWAFVYQENKIVWAKFTIHFERALSGFGSMFYCCEHTNWWTAVAYESKVSINIELSCRDAYIREDTEHFIPRIRRDVLFLLEKQTESPLFTRPSKRFRLHALPCVLILCRLLRIFSNADCHVLSRYTLHFDL